MTTIMGVLIKMNRIHQNINQKTLCEGICVPSYLSKIENGETIATPELINELFDVLGITYTNSEVFIEEGMHLFEEYFSYLGFNDFDESTRLFEVIEKEHEAYIHSPLIIDYYLVRLSHYCSTPWRERYEEAKVMLQQVEHQMNNKQHMRYNLYQAIDILQLTTEYDKGMAYLCDAKEWGENGHIFYWMSMANAYLNKSLQAMKFAYKALNIYLRDGNVTSLFSTYILIGKIYMMEGEYVEAHKYYQRAEKIGKALKAPLLKGYLNNKIAWCLLCQRDYEGARKCVGEDTMPRETMDKLETEEIKIMIGLGQGDYDYVREAILFADQHKFLNDSNIKKWGKICIEKEGEEKQKVGREILAEILQQVNKVIDTRHYFKKELIEYYKFHRYYKEAVKVLE